MALQLGIDFGTTRTAVACADRGNHPVVDFTDAGGRRAPWIPTLVAERDGELRYGLDAAAVAGDPSFTLVRSFKRAAGRRRTRGPGSACASARSEVPAGELVDRVPRARARGARDALGRRGGRSRRRAALRAAVAVPANAHGAQRLVTLDAFRRAGFEPLAMLNEPSAAGFEYTHRHRDTLSSRRDLVVVYDLGGGTFDASLVRMSGKRHEVLAHRRRPALGGDDFDAVLADLALARAGCPAAALDRASRASASSTCAARPRSRSSTASRKVTLDLEAALGPGRAAPEVTLPVAEYYEACAPLVERTDRRHAPADDAHRGRGERRPTSPRSPASTSSAARASCRSWRARCASASDVASTARPTPPPPSPSACRSRPTPPPASSWSTATRAPSASSARHGRAARSPSTPSSRPTPSCLRVRGETLERTRTYRAAHNLGHYRFFECSAFDDARTPARRHGALRRRLLPVRPAPARRPRSRAHPGRAARRARARVTERYRLDDKGMVDVVIRDQDSGYERSYRLGRI